MGGKEAEHRAASSVKERKDWSYARWSEEVTKVLVAVENAIWPDLFIAGGGISRKADKWIPLLKNRTPVVAATLLNTAGIVGAALANWLLGLLGVSLGGGWISYLIAGFIGAVIIIFAWRAIRGAT